MAVHRPSEAGPSSSSHPSENHHEDRTNTPPPYSGPTTPSMTAPSAPQPQPNYPGLPRLDYSLYSPKGFTISSDATTLTSKEQRLSVNPVALVSLIKSLATVPPKPQIRITGRTSDSGSIDFDVKINLMNLIVPDEDKRGRMNYVKIIGPGDVGFRGEGKETTFPHVNGLEAWAQKYCEDPASIKRFTLERTVINWDTSYLEGRLLSLISSTSYRGHVTITFPMTHSRVVVHSPDEVNNFFSSVNMFFSSITKGHTGTKKYEVVKSIWPYADVARGEYGRRCAVQEEEVWFADWRDAIRHAILSKRRGWVTAEDRLEFLMVPKPGKLGPQPAGWGGNR
ncbi:uncharacterized protein LY89DRAFT_589743 [Mollisia scopiformis]|uniref:Uncharacterized protein n=1 Tax=Mollisia scopiformis TaxID=149040 RepID=A0A194X1T8_MOLSC|nr:uncharacterized protein LY89DRAFT_589743 [Mollisia scopiformis]KUJ14168.1 hypothetical protein LY89DRAFT_589743 [Mollisia scopiformis]